MPDPPQLKCWNLNWYMNNIYYARLFIISSIPGTSATTDVGFTVTLSSFLITNIRLGTVWITLAEFTPSWVFICKVVRARVTLVTCAACKQQCNHTQGHFWSHNNFVWSLFNIIIQSTRCNIFISYGGHGRVTSVKGINEVVGHKYTYLCYQNTEVCKIIIFVSFIVTNYKGV